MLDITNIENFCEDAKKRPEKIGAGFGGGSSRLRPGALFVPPKQFAGLNIMATFAIA